MSDIQTGTRLFSVGKERKTAPITQKTTPITSSFLEQMQHTAQKDIATFAREHGILGEAEKAAFKATLSDVSQVDMTRHYQPKHRVDEHPDRTLYDFSTSTRDLSTSSLLAKTDSISTSAYNGINREEFQACLIEQDTVREVQKILTGRGEGRHLVPDKWENVDVISKDQMGWIVAVLEEMKVYGVDAVSTYYNALDGISHQKTNAAIDTFAFRAEERLRDLPLSGSERKMFETYIAEHAKKQREVQHTYTNENKEKLKLDSKDKVSLHKLKTLFDEMWDDLEFFAHPSTKGVLHNVPKLFLDGMFNGRAVASKLFGDIADVNDLKQVAWHARVGRLKEIGEYYQKYAQVKDIQTLKRYEERVQDEYLLTEASAFEIRENIKVPENADATALVQQAMYTLLKIHRPRGQERVNFTIFYGEDKMQKISVPTREDIDSASLMASIKRQIEKGEVTDILNAKGEVMSEKERVDLGYKKYSLKRENDANYRAVYGHGEAKALDGDYVIQIKDSKTIADFNTDTLSHDSPESIFAVDNHKAGVIIDRRQKFVDSATTKVAIKYRHKEFDGMQAEIHADKIFSTLQDENSYPEAVTIPGLTAESVYSLPPLEGVVYAQREGKVVLVQKGHETKYPTLTFSSVALARDIKKEKKNKKNKPSSKAPSTIKIGGSFTRGLIDAVANEAKSYHFLHAASKENLTMYADLGDRFDNLQPVYTSMAQLLEQFDAWKKGDASFNPTFVREFMTRYRGLIDRATAGNSDPMVMAAIPGGLENFMYALGKSMHGGADLLKTPGSMVSFLRKHESDKADGQMSEPRKVEFETAIASSYELPINLEKPIASMGVLGSVQYDDRLVTTCRKLPCHAQVAFHELVKDINGGIVDNEDGKELLGSFTTLIRSWNGLMKDAVPYTEYEKVRNDVFEKIVSGDLAGQEYFSREHIETVDDFQKALNTTLTKSAENTLDRKKIETAKSEFISFMQDAGIETS